MTQNKFKKIFVGGLPPQTSESDMREYFSKYGEVCDVVAMRDKTGNKSRGFGFVVFKDPESVDRCQAERPHYLLGKLVDTKRAMPKEESINPDIHCNSKRIFIGGIRKFFTEDDLRTYFSSFGQVVDCTIKRDNISGISRGFAFITFTDRDIVDKVILSKPHQIKNCIVDVKKALSPEELRQIDENHSFHNSSDYDMDYSRMGKNGSFEHDEDGKIITDSSSLNGGVNSKYMSSPCYSNSKFSPKRSHSYHPDYTSGTQPTSPISNTAGFNSAGVQTAPPPYSYDTQVPMIWMSVQQCPNGLLLTPVVHDVYNGGPLSSFFFPPTTSATSPAPGAHSLAASFSASMPNYFPGTPQLIAPAHYDHSITQSMNNTMHTQHFPTSNNMIINGNNSDSANESSNSPSKFDNFTNDLNQCLATMKTDDSGKPKNNSTEEGTEKQNIPANTSDLISSDGGCSSSDEHANSNKTSQNTNEKQNSIGLTNNSTAPTVEVQ